MTSENNNQSRRSFLKNSILSGTLLPLAYGDLASLFSPRIESPLKIHLFSKHLQFLNFKDMAEVAAELGFDGVDLTVRPNGHVLPERVQNDLPLAVEAIRKVGFAPLIMTTAVQDASDNIDKQVLASAARLGFKYYRMNWFSYPDGKPLPESMQLFQNKVKEIGALNRKLGLTGCYQNHAGNLVGSSLWELWELLKNADEQHMGVQYDIRHAVVEGGLSWQNGLRLMQSKIKLLTIKDFHWEKINGQWNVHNTPLGEGMIDFKTYFKLLKQYQVNVPVSLHFEYDLGGAEHGATRLSVDKQVVFNAMKRDLKKLRELWEQV